MTLPDAFRLLGLEQPEAFAARMRSDPKRLAMLADLATVDPRDRSEQQTGRTTAMLVRAAADAVAGRRVWVWVLPGQAYPLKWVLDEMVRKLVLDATIRKLDHTAVEPVVRSSPPRLEDVVLDRVAASLYRDHAVEHPWPAGLLHEVELRNAVLQRPATAATPAE